MAASAPVRRYPVNLALTLIVKVSLVRVRILLFAPKSVLLLNRLPTIDRTFKKHAHFEPGLPRVLPCIVDQVEGVSSIQSKGSGLSVQILRLILAGRFA